MQFITITLDPEVDSPEVLRAYSQRVGAELDNWVFLRGEQEELQKVLRPFGFLCAKAGERIGGTYCKIFSRRSGSQDPGDV